MAKLNGVKTLNDHEIEHGGERYVKTEGPAQLGDIVRSETGLRSGAEKGEHYFVDTSRGGYVGFEDDDGDMRGVDDFEEDAFSYGIGSSEITIFRRVSNAQPQSPAEIRATIDKKRAEIAELEALLTVNVGDYVRVEASTFNGEIDAGTIARVDKNDDSAVPYYLVSIVGGIGDWAHADDVTKITPAAAKAALLAQIEEAFKGAQQSA